MGFAGSRERCFCYGEGSGEAMDIRGGCGDDVSPPQPP